MAKAIAVFSDIAELNFEAVHGLLMHEAKELGLPVMEQDEGHLMVGSAFGSFGITACEPGIRLHVRAQSEDNLSVLRDSLLEHLKHFLPEIMADLRWSDAPVAGSLPVNFQFAEVLAVEDLGVDFYRVQLKLARFATFKDESIHFRLVLPDPKVADPEWPSLKENGSIAWPKGEKELHRPVYTARTMDHETGVLTVDIYRHDGGRTSGWAAAAKPGDQVAMIGPGGSGILTTPQVTLCGDETAYPALARIVESLPEGAQGQVILANASGARDYPFPTRDGLEVSWCDAATGTLAAAAQQAQTAQPEAFLWFASEAAEVAEMRKHIKAAGWSKETFYAAAYWVK